MHDNLCIRVRQLQLNHCFVDSGNCTDEPVCVLDVVNLDGDYDIVESAYSNAAALDNHLAEASKSPYVTRVYSISQSRSYAPLNITDGMFKCIMVNHNVMCEFCELVACFQKTTDRTEDSYCGPLLKRCSVDKLEFAYIFKYPESNGRTDGADSWSLRKMAVYYQYDRISQQVTWILLNPRPHSPAWKRILDIFHYGLEADQTPPEQFAVHDTILSSYVDNWKPYLLQYEEQISIMSRRMTGAKIHHTVDSNYDTLTRIRYIESKVLPLRHVFSSYCRLMAELQDMVIGTGCGETSNRPDSGISIPAWLFNHRQRVAAYRDNVEALISQCRFAGQLLCDTASFKQSKYALELTKLSVDDSATVRVITIITLAYLSFTVVATIMEMPFFHLKISSGALEMSPQFWKYLAISVPLTLLTIGFWKITLWLKTKERHKRFPLEAGNAV